MIEQRWLDQLAACVRARDRTEYYKVVTRSGDPYGGLALSVVKQSLLAGRVAKSYAEAVATMWNRPITTEKWLQISEALMRADFAARQVDRSFEPGTPFLRYDVIRAYHVDTFKEVDELPGLAWTAWVPLEIDGPGKGQKLWHRLVTEDFLTVAVQTCWLTLGAVVHQAGVEPHDAVCARRELEANPPVVSKYPSDTVARMCRAVFNMPLSDNQLLAAFYLSVLGRDSPELVWRLGGIAPTSAWQSLRPMLRDALAKAGGADGYPPWQPMN